MMMIYLPYLLSFPFLWIFTSYLFSLLSRRRRNLPPGPIPLPIIGNLHNLGNKPHASAASLAQIYGPVMCLQFGSVTTIIISSPSSAKEVLRKKDVSFSHRTVPNIVKAYNHSDFSVTWLPPHDEWRNLRKIANSLLFSTSRMDSGSHLRKTKVNDFLTHVDACRRAGVAVNIGEAGFDTMMNLLTNMFFSVDVADLQLGLSSKSSGFKEIVWQILNTSGEANLSDYFPLFKWWDPKGLRGKVEAHIGELLGFFDCLIDERLELEARSSDSSDGDTLDALMKLVRETSGGFNRVYLRHLLADLFIAGTDTTSSTLEWVMTELLKNPMKMKKAQEELKSIIGRNNILEEGDISKLPYLQAVIKETFRLHPPAPFLLPRKATADVELCDFMVPKDSQVLVNVWAISKDPNVWKNADEFQPERFIGSNMDVKGQDFELTPFGAGRRICPGMPLATRMLPMMLMSLLYSFDWRLEDGVLPENIDMEEKLCLTLLKAQPLMAIPLSKV